MTKRYLGHLIGFKEYIFVKVFNFYIIFNQSHILKIQTSVINVFRKIKLETINHI